MSFYSSPDRWTHPRDAIAGVMERIYKYRMTTTSGGNLSVRGSDGSVWISPARVDKGNLQRHDIVRVCADDSIDGPHRPSSELPFHQAIYAARPDLRAIVHAHPAALVAFSICRQTPNTRLFHQAHAVCGEPGFAAYALPGSRQLGENIAATFRRGFNCVILENHGVVVGGASLPEAFQRFEALEFAGKTLIKARQLGDVRFLSDPELAQAQNRQAAWKDFTPALAGDRERELRRQLCDFVRRGCRQRLLISTEGSFSARLADDAFLITPSQQDREGLTSGDVVLVQGDGCEADKRPSRAALAHRAIYQQHAAVESIVFAHPVNATAFSVTDVPLDSRTIPESYIFLRDVPRLPYGLHYGPDRSLSKRVGPEAPAALLQNDGVLVTGASVLDAFDRLEVLESTAEAMINSRALGEIAPMSDSVIEDLRRAFQLPPGASE